MSSDGKKDPVMPVYGRDFYDDEAVMLMSLEQEALYWRLLTHAWREGSIPDHVDQIALLVASKCSRTRFRKLWPAIATKWVPDGSGRLRNKRLEHERAVRLELRQKRSESGRAGNDARWSSDRKPIANGSHASDRTAIPSIPIPSVGGSEGARAEIRKCLFELGVLRLSAKKLETLAATIAAAGWGPNDLRRLAEQVKGKTPAHRAARLAGLLRDDKNRDVAIRAAASSDPAPSLTHQQNMPLGIASCACAECVSFRARRNGGAA